MKFGAGRGGDLKKQGVPQPVVGQGIAIMLLVGDFGKVGKGKLNNPIVSHVHMLGLARHRIATETRSDFPITVQHFVCYLFVFCFCDMILLQATYHGI